MNIEFNDYQNFEWYKNDIDPNVIDDEILDIIEYINSIKDIKTKFCCAEYGISRNYDGSEGIHKGVCKSPYIVIEYKNRKALEFHNILNNLSDYGERVPLFEQVCITGPLTYAYYLFNNSIPRKITTQDIIRKWDMIREFLGINNEKTENN